MIQNKKTELPAGLQGLYQSFELGARKSIEKGDYTAAEKDYRKLLDEFFTAQGKTTRYHKGGVYHQIGYCLYMQQKKQEALLYFKYAFIEDCFSDADVTQLPAYSNLYNIYRVSAKQLSDLRLRIKPDICNSPPLNAEDYLKAYLDSGGKLDSLPVNKSDNIFVGGNYKNIALLKFIADSVRKCDLSSIMAIDSNVTKDEDIYADAMALLHDCGSAIFEITFDSGHLMELEEARKMIPKENILLLFQKRNETTDHYISKMLLGIQVKLAGYMKIEEIPKIVAEFLRNIRRDI
jgi:tetratricopeptide (TPR) repeat protein